MAGLGLAGAGRSVGATDALFELVKTRMLEEQQAAQERQRSFDRNLQTQQMGRLTAQDQIAADERTKEAQRLRFDTLKGQPQADINANLGPDYSTGQTVQGPPNPAFPGGGPTYQIGQNPQSMPMDVNGAKVRPISMEALNAAARAKSLTTAMDTPHVIGEGQNLVIPSMGTIASGAPKVEPKTAVAGRIGPHGGPVFVDPKTLQEYEDNKPIEPGQTKEKPPQVDPGAGEARRLARLDRSYNTSVSELNKLRMPVLQQADRLERVRVSLDQNTPQADALIAPELLTAMAGGQGSGLRMNEAEISRVVNGRSNWESLKAAINKWQLDPSKALSITPVQRQQIRDLHAAMDAKMRAKLDLFDKSDEALNLGETPEDHHRIMTDMRKALTAETTGPSGPPAGSTVSVTRGPDGKLIIKR